jgi:hypothetical protein
MQSSGRTPLFSFEIKGVSKNGARWSLSVSIPYRFAAVVAAMAMAALAGVDLDLRELVELLRVSN